MRFHRKGSRGLCFFLLFLFSFASCGAGPILGLSSKEAAERLERGDIDFILKAESSRFRELLKLHPSAAFYAGIQAAAAKLSGEEAAAAKSRALDLFILALESPSPLVRKEAEEKLLLPVLEDWKGIRARRILDIKISGESRNSKNRPDLSPRLRAAACYVLGRFSEIENLYPLGSVSAASEGLSWERAFSFLALLNREAGEDAGDLRREVLAFFLGTNPDPAWRWALEEVRRLEPEFFSPSEEAAIAGRLAVSRSAYPEALKQFRVVLEEEKGLFFRCPEMISDLGRTFQYSSARAEGAELFPSWAALLKDAAREEGEKNPEPGSDSDSLALAAAGLNQDTLKLLRFRLLFFAGRIERQRGQYDRGLEYFTQALELAPDPFQLDACLWYLISTALNQGPEKAAPLIRSYLPRRNSAPYFSDVLDSLSHDLVSRRQWRTMLEIFPLIRSYADGAITAQYAWILGRALEESYLTPGKGEAEEFHAESFFKISFEEADTAFYYRALSASKLGNSFALSEENSPPGRNKALAGSSDEMDFLLNFFKFGAASFVLPYLRNLEADLTIPELRKLAEALNTAAFWMESLALISRYMIRADYELNARDLALYYPQPFKDLIEKNSRDHELGPEILYGLVRTESAFVPSAVSRSGAQGLTQLMLPTALEMAGRIVRTGGPDYRSGTDLKTLDLKDPGVNLHLGAYYLRYLTGLMGSPLLAILSYNGGMGRVRRWLAADRSQGKELPGDLFLESVEYSETREYGRRVLAAAAAYGYLYYDMSMEAVVADIYKRN